MQTPSLTKNPICSATGTVGVLEFGVKNMFETCKIVLKTAPAYDGQKDNYLSFEAFGDKLVNLIKDQLPEVGDVATVEFYVSSQPWKNKEGVWVYFPKFSIKNIVFHNDRAATALPEIEEPSGATFEDLPF